jgi:beta-galactosidase
MIALQRIKNLTICIGLTFLGIICIKAVDAQGVKFNRDLSPAEGLIKPQEKPFREEICLNGRWDFQPVAIPANWVAGKGIAPDLTEPDAEKWEGTKIKIPSPWNVNEWGGGSKVGKGTDLPYAPGSVYYPSYPESWAKVRMGWLKRDFTVPATWKDKRIVLHFEAVAGDCVILVNGKDVGHNMDAYLPFEIDITDNIKQGKSNELLVGIRHRKLFDKTNAQYSKMSATYPPGSNTHDLIGIWQDVFLQALPPIHVQTVFAKPFVDKDDLEFEVKLTNQSTRTQTIKLSANVKEWLNLATGDAVTAAEINWRLGKTALQLQPISITLNAGETQTVNLKTKVEGRLKLWSPDHPNLYTLILNASEGGTIIDCKTERFGWRSLTIKNKDFLLNGQKIQCFGDLQHPFGPYITSRRFAWAWYKMIKDVGGNAVRPHAQPWPRVYYDLADEMGLMVLDEDALFGSSIALNLEEGITWDRTAQEIDRLILRDRNHPSVIGWSVGNEIFAIALLNKPAPDVAKVWDSKMVKLAQLALSLDPTRTLVTSDGDKDLDGNLPVWSKHFGHGLKLDQLPNINKPLVIGESGATYYGKPKELFPYIGLKAYGTYYQRNEALAIDVYQNIVQMARPMLSYYSPSELCWFGIEHMNLGYHDYSRLPDERDGIFPGKPYEEGKPGYQYERIPPYVTTFNPGLDSSLPVYKPLPMFEAMKAALAKNKPAPSKWDHFQDTSWQKPSYPSPIYNKALFIGKADGPLAKLFVALGLNIDHSISDPSLIIIDGENATDVDMRQNKTNIERIKKDGGLIWVLVKNDHVSSAIKPLLPISGNLIPMRTTALQSDTTNKTGKLFNLRDLYFSEIIGDKYVMKYAFTGDILKRASVVLKAAATDWYLFNGASENRKCAQEVLYEHLQKPANAALLTLPANHGTITLSSIDYTIATPETMVFWKKLCAAMAIKLNNTQLRNGTNKKDHDLLMDGPVN